MGETRILARTEKHYKSVLKPWHLNGLGIARSVVIAIANLD